MKQIFTLIMLLGSFGLFAQNIVVLKATQDSLLQADAGADTTFTMRRTGYYLGGEPTARGGDQLYFYKWSPENLLSTHTEKWANPSTEVQENTTFILMLSDGKDCTATDSITLTFDYPNSLEKVSAENLSIYPNPVNDYFKIGLEANGELRIRLSNISGTVLWEKEGRVEELTTSELAIEGPSGLYILNVWLNGEELTQEIISKQ